MFWLQLPRGVGVVLNIVKGAQRAGTKNICPILFWAVCSPTKTAKFHAQGLPLSDLKQADMPMYKKKMTMALYRHRVLKLHTRGKKDQNDT